MPRWENLLHVPRFLPSFPSRYLDPLLIAFFQYDYVEVTRDTVNRLDAELGLASKSDQSVQSDQPDSNDLAKDANVDIAEKSTAS